ncbi:MAG: hypE [Caloramator sp.]|jgi:hydrogenase expression/formation protein HypE|uniref:hydrogenase expression/formation protein HypE n=1 Tax=Caloramator sp. TaxID=1871330 RepID=UPI001D72F3B8|nr:hydrogenase expression/formation protein HypE [Caloramator sp.]MBZ4662352.1 hypE [Caloramator sp.]
MDDIITLSYGSGGKKTSHLIEDIILPSLSCDELNKLSDGAVLDVFSNKIAFSTDSFVVSPYFFPGGDIGKLAVCGTVNDLSVSGAKPEYLSLSLIIEEGFKIEELKKIIKSIEETAKICNVKIVTGDTKVVEKGKGDGIYINTSGIGRLMYENLGKDKISERDIVIVTGCIGDHGAAIMASRNNLVDEFNVKSDCAPVYELAQCILQYGDKVKIMRDPTRGGVATTLNEFIENSEFTIEIWEEKIPINVETNNLCEILGIDPLYSANEGKILAIVDSSVAKNVVNDLRKIELGKNAAIIGSVTKNFPSKVVLHTNLGGKRVLSKLTGAQLPRIC